MEISEMPDGITFAAEEINGEFRPVIILKVDAKSITFTANCTFGKLEQAQEFMTAVEDGFRSAKDIGWWRIQ